MNWKDELKDKFDWMQNQDYFLLEDLIESLLKKERIRENDYWIGHTLNNENWTINKMDFEKRNLELEGGSKLNQMRNYEPSITLDQEEIV